MRISTVDRREQLIEAAITVIKRDGVQSASLRTIASEANASLAAVHVCFTDKDELMQAAAAELLQQLVRAIPQVIDGPDHPKDIAHLILDSFWAQMVSDETYVIAQFELGMWSKRNPGHSGLSRTVYSEYETEIARLLTISLDRMDLKPGIPIGDLARGLVVIMDGCSLQYFADPGNPNHKALCDLMVDAYLDKAGL
ncbi:TetR/AcrR family transcriptional regulator [Paenarthrobacter sp. TA1.8]|uniref:TetR/AcrR family transcriptional regulator n=1 Tax=Paenarthrobacter sp. TA1.8 TaxID=3400219 RepID=UPI003B42BE02